MEIIDTDFENWGAYLMKQFQAMYEKNERCDLEINCNKQVFLVHRLLMAACSDYIRELGDTQHIILPEEISCKTLKTIIDFMYSGKIVFRKEDKDDLLIAASLLNMRLLLELIKREDSSSYTISMDDDNDENCEAELINNGTSENCRISSDTNSERGPNSQTTTKRKSDRKSVKNKSSKKNCLVLPPLHKFPYLQQKFSGSRTYGLITSFTKPSPSRFEISDAELEMNSIRSTFHDVTYDTVALIDADSVKPLEAAHKEFLKQNSKPTTANRRSFANALFSPFDKYNPPCNVKLADSMGTRRPESVVSYPSKADATFNVRKYRVSNTALSKETNSRASLSQTVSTTTTPVPSRKEYKKPDTAAKAASSSTSPPVEKRVRFSEEVNVREMDIPFADAITNDLEALPEPIMPSAIVQDASSLRDGGHEVEFIKLNNVVVPSDSREDERLNFMESQVDAASVSVVQSDECDSANTNAETISDFAVNEIIDVNMEVNQSTCPVSSELGPNFSTALAFENDSCAAQVPVDSVACVPEEPKVAENVCPVQDSRSIPEEPQRDDDISIIEDSELSSRNDKSNVTPELTKSPNVVESVSTDPTLFTPLNADTNSTQTSAELNSQIFAFKVKGTESPAQIDKLVDLCKNNPLFKNKNLRFKIVPVKGAISEKLKETTFKPGGSINKAIIVKRTVNSTSALATSSSDKSPVKLAEASQRVNSPDDGTTNSKKDRLAYIENVTGPWFCSTCGTEPITFESYYAYRIHQHSIHKEPNNPIYCIYCGHKSLKRNMQLYHSFVKHNVRPPSHVRFPKCDKCEFFALNEYYLQKHLICHPSEGKEYVCSCKVAFKSSDLLQKHMVSGDCKNTKSFACGYCRGIFDRFVNLKAHMRVCMKERSKPMLDSSATSNSSSERNVKTITDGGKDYLSL